MPWSRHSRFALVRGLCPAVSNPVCCSALRRGPGDLHCSLFSVCHNQGCQQWKEHAWKKSAKGRQAGGEAGSETAGSRGEGVSFLVLVPSLGTSHSGLADTAAPKNM